MEGEIPSGPMAVLQQLARVAALIHEVGEFCDFASYQVSDLGKKQSVRRSIPNQSQNGLVFPSTSVNMSRSKLPPWPSLRTANNSDILLEDSPTDHGSLVSSQHIKDPY